MESECEARHIYLGQRHNYPLTLMHDIYISVILRVSIVLQIKILLTLYYASYLFIQYKYIFI